MMDLGRLIELVLLLIIAILVETICAMGIYSVAIEWWADRQYQHNLRQKDDEARRRAASSPVHPDPTLCLNRTYGFVVADGRYYPLGGVEVHPLFTRKKELR